MKVSVVVPTYDRPERIATCVAALQAQEGVALEIVIVDDGSPRPVADLPAGPHPLRVLRQANAGPAAARNRGVAAATGDLICLTDDDCSPAPGWAAAFARAAAGAARPTLLGGRTVNVAPGLFARASQDMADYLSRVGGAEPFFASNNIAVPRAAWTELGGFDTGYRRAAGEDRAFCRAWTAAGYAFAEVPDAVVAHNHTLDARGFWRQHRNYGFGAHRYHATAKARRPTGGHMPDANAPQNRTGGFGSPMFYLRLVAAPLRRGEGIDALGRSALVGAAQVATFFGYVEARRETARSKVRGEDG
jgi:glycosyltransferase involved in cell wall biosynthesis